jgi:hypothetical protein
LGFWNQNRTQTRNQPESADELRSVHPYCCLIVRKNCWTMVRDLECTATPSPSVKMTTNPSAMLAESLAAFSKSVYNVVSLHQISLQILLFNINSSPSLRINHV